MKILKYITFLFVGMLLLNSCDKSLEEINDDPTRLSEVELRLLLPDALTQSAFNQGNNTERVAGLIMQQLKGLDAQQIQYGDNYLLGEDVMNNYWRTGLYSGVLRSCQVIIDKSEAEGATFYSGVAKIIQGNNYALAASMFGDIPFSQALQGLENAKPVYDTQESVYNGAQALIDAGIADLGSATGYAGGDLYYDGDAAKWIAAANALKARYHMHLTKRDNKSYENALAALANAFTSNADAPVFTFGTAQTDNWSLAKFGQERPSTIGFNQQFSDIMTARQDTLRLAKYTNANLDYWQSGNTDLYWTQDNAAVPMISFAELKFIEAEALLATGADATAALEEAIGANMAQLGLSGDEVTAYIAANNDATLENIMTQAYIAYYGQAFNSSWTNWRRTGVPSLTASPDASLSFSPSGTIPVRYLYVESETQTNSDNVSAARASQSGALLDVAPWAFQ